MTARYIYTSPANGRTQELGLPQLLHPEFDDLGEASTLTGNLMAMLVDKGYLALYEALQIAGVSPESVKVKQPETHPCLDEHQPGCDCVIPEQTATPTPPFLERMVASKDAQPHVHLAYAANSKQHKTDIGWLIEKLQADRRDYLAHDARALRISRLISFLTEELGR